MRRPVMLMLAALAGLGLAETTRSATPAAPGLTPVRGRITDPAIARDRRALEGLGRRLAAFDSVAAPGRVYTRALAQAWLALAREQYAVNDRSGLVEEAFERASSLAATLESRGVMLRPQSRETVGSPPIRPDLWKLADSLKHTEALRCVAEEVARLELTLVRAGHEVTMCRPGDPHPHAAAATAQAARVRVLSADCILPVAIAPAAPEATLPEAAPASVPDPIRAALRRLGAFGNVHFDLNADTISVTSAAVLDNVVAVMRSVPEIHATLIGHTDPRGSVAYNLALGQRRASAVRDYVVHGGVDPGRISIGSQGKTSPVAIGVGTREHALNRRVEIQYAAPVDAQLSVRHQERDLQLEKTRPKAPAASPHRPTTGARKRAPGSARPDSGTAQATPR